MWIRSQDKKGLANINEFWIGNGHIYGAYSTTADGNGCSMLGNYTEAEAIKALDMIQGFINGPEKVTEWVRQPDVFQMPPAGFSEEKFIPDCGCDFCGLIDPAKAGEIREDQYCDNEAICKFAWKKQKGADQCQK